MATCEMCGREIYSRPITIEIEGAELSVCPSCSKHGKKVIQPKSRKPRTSVGSHPQQRDSSSRSTSTRAPRQVERVGELVTNYFEKIRLARQKMKISQKEVAIQTKISTSELQSIETGKIRPSDKIIGILEKFYNIKLTEEIQSYRPKDQKKGPSFQTLGDIVVIKKKDEEE
ncbi:MAG: multiprotein bridging factor aMBF1 [Candidatus Heimdallarchaeota archaeon]